MSRHAAGRDLSSDIRVAPHGPEVLARVRALGDLEGEGAKPWPAASPEPAASPARTIPGWADAILSRHPHPVSVHFPIALSVAGAVFTAIGIFLDSEALEAAGLFNLVFGAIAAPGAISAGLFSWKFNYGGALTRTFKAKMLLSVAYLAVAGTAVGLRLLVPATGRDGTHVHVAYVGLVVLLPLVAMSLGYLGGTMTFPKRWEC